MDIHGYQPPWKALSEFALHQDLDRMDANAPQFQHLVGQVSQDSSLFYYINFMKLFLKIVLTAVVSCQVIFCWVYQDLEPEMVLSIFPTKHGPISPPCYIKVQ